VRELYRWNGAELEVEARPGYLHVVAWGAFDGLDRQAEVHALLDTLLARQPTRRGLLDLRDAQGWSLGEPDAASWEWLRSGRGFELLAYLVREDVELDGTRIDMTALSFGLAVRCFTNVTDAHRWLSTRSRASTQSMAAVRAGEPGSEPPGSTRSVPPGRLSSGLGTAHASSSGMAAMRTLPPRSSWSQSMQAVRSDSDVPASSRSQNMPAVRTDTDPPASGRSQSMPAVRDETDGARPRTSTPPAGWPAVGNDPRRRDG
jgi:hypothetical protein